MIVRNAGLLRTGLPPLLQEREHGRVLLLPDQLVARHAEARVELRENSLVVILARLLTRQQFSACLDLICASSRRAQPQAILKD